MPVIAEGFLYFTHFFKFLNHGNVHIAHGILVFLLLLVGAVIFNRSLKAVEQEIVPDGKTSIKNIFQTGVGALLNLARAIIPHHTEDYFPLLGGIFFYVFISNMLGIIPGFLPPTESLSTNLAMGLTVYVYYNAMGIKQQGFKNYFAHFFGPSIGDGMGMMLLRFGFLAPLMFVIEIISHSVRPVSLSLRLFCNINGDHMVVSIFNSLTPLLVPVVFLAFGIFVAFIQAFVFTLLTTIYIGLAVETHHHEEAHAH